MLTSKAIFEHKLDCFKPQDCSIEKVVHLESDEYDRFRNNMLDEYDFIRENSGLMRCDGNGIFHCLLVVGENRRDGILLESEGYNYGRYSAFLPNAADFLAMNIDQLPAQAQKPKQDQTGPTFGL